MSTAAANRMPHTPSPLRMPLGADLLFTEPLLEPTRAGRTQGRQAWRNTGKAFRCDDVLSSSLVAAQIFKPRRIQMKDRLGARSTLVVGSDEFEIF